MQLFDAFSSYLIYAFFSFKLLNQNCRLFLFEQIVVFHVEHAAQTRKHTQGRFAVTRLPMTDGFYAHAKLVGKLSYMFSFFEDLILISQKLRVELVFLGQNTSVGGVKTVFD